MKLLLIEDSLDDVAFLRDALQVQQADHVELTRVGSFAEARERLPGGTFDCVLLDLDLPDATGIECVDAVRSLDERLPTVALSSPDDETLALGVLNRGAQDFLVKWESQGRTVLRTVSYAIERRRAELRLSFLAQFDPLTEIGNRQYFQDQLERAVARHGARATSRCPADR